MDESSPFMYESTKYFLRHVRHVVLGKAINKVIKCFFCKKNGHLSKTTSSMKSNCKRKISFTHMCILNSIL